MGWRRQRSRLRRLRRFLIEHRLGAAEVAFGLVAGALGLWLIWPSSGGEPAVHRQAQQQSPAADQVPNDPSDTSASREIEPAPAEDGSTSAELDVAGVLDAAAALAEPGPSREPPSTQLAPAEPQAPAVEPLIARLRDLRVSLVPEDQRPSLRPPAARGPEALGRVGRAGLRGEIVVGWLSRVEDLTARPEQNALVAALPVIRPERQGAGVPAWVRNAAVPPRVHQRPMIAIVIDDLGMNRRNTAALNQLPGPLTLAFLPYADALEEQTGAALAAGHELLVHMPMEPMGEAFPGPDALLRSLQPDQFEARLRAALERFSGFVGLNNHMGSRLTADREHMAMVMAELRRRDLLFLDSKTTARSIASDEAKRQGVPFVERNVFLDNEADLEHIVRQLERTEDIARQSGAAVAIGHPHDLTLQALRRWLPTLERRGFALVPISTVVAQRSCAGETPMPGCGSLRIELPVGALAGAAANRQG